MSVRNAKGQQHSDNLSTKCGCTGAVITRGVSIYATTRRRGDGSPQLHRKGLRRTNQRGLGDPLRYARIQEETIDGDPEWTAKYFNAGYP